MTYVTLYSIGRVIFYMFIYVMTSGVTYELNAKEFEVTTNGAMNFYV